MKNQKKDRLITAWSLWIIIPAFLLALNLVMAQINGNYASFVTGKVNNAVAALSGDRMVLVNDPDGPALAQGGAIPGINMQKAEEAAKKAKDKAEGKAEPEQPAATKPAAAAGKPAAKKKAPKPIDPVMLGKALDFFQTSLINRDVILIGQTDKITLGDKTFDKPYISTSFRDNPFDMVEQVDINPSLMLNKLPPEPFYPPPGSATINVTGEEFKKYVETIKLKGVIILGGKNYAFINTGQRSFFKTPGEDYKDKFTVNIDDVSLDAVLVSDEFGNKGILDFDFRKGFQVQPVENVLFITNIGGKS